ncbi:hypothetical protein IMY05_C4502000500 [Salix suchowensis]|nr:hypothetical protein IMY05_C4502000500 [Salix suchowensis]
MSHRRYQCLSKKISWTRQAEDWIEAKISWAPSAGPDATVSRLVLERRKSERGCEQGCAKEATTFRRHFNETESRFHEAELASRRRFKVQMEGDCQDLQQHSGHCTSGLGHSGNLPTDTAYRPVEAWASFRVLRRPPRQRYPSYLRLGTPVEIYGALNTSRRGRPWWRRQVLCIKDTR